MKEICIINYGSSAAVYGIGTFIKEYIQCLIKMNYKVNSIELGIDNNNNFFYVKNEENMTRYHIPYVQNTNAQKYDKAVCRLLRLYIKDSPGLIFHFNYFDRNALLDEIKRCFPLSKSVITVHYLHWSARLSGNVAQFEKLLRKQNVEKQYQDIIEQYNKEKSYLDNVDAVVSLCEDTYHLLLKTYKVDRSKLRLIHNGVANSRKRLSSGSKLRLRQKYHIPDNEKIILFVGRVAPIKGIYPMLNCFNKIVEGYPNCRLVVIGGGDINDAISACRNVWNKVTFTGRVDKKELMNWYQIADLTVFPSFYEECSYVGMEMMMHGLPVIASDGYSVRNMFNKDNAIIAEIKNMSRSREFEEELVRSIFTALQSEELLIEMAKASRETYEKKYRLDMMQKNYQELLTSL